MNELQSLIANHDYFFQQEISGSEANKEFAGNVFYDRLPLTVKDWVDNKTFNLEFSGRARMSAGFRNWRHVIMGGATSGTTLS